MLVQCPHCGGTVAVNGLGRRPLNISLRIVCEALQIHCNAAAAANELNCSPAYIFGVLKATGLKLKDLVNSKAMR